MYMPARIGEIPNAVTENSGKYPTILETPKRILGKQVKSGS